MNRLLVTIRWDIQLQTRHGFYYVALVLILLWSTILAWLPGESLAWIFPAFVVNHLVIGAFYFMGGLVLLEKGEGTLQAQLVTPLRTAEYLLSKWFTLTLLAVLETVLLVWLTYRLQVQIVWLLAGVVAASGLFCLTGFLAVIRYPSLNEYLLPSFLLVSLLTLPLISYAGFEETWLFYLHPLQAVLLLLQAAFQETAVWQLLYSLLYTTLWISFLFRRSQFALQQYVQEA